MSEHRWTKFWWQDWQRDPALRMCSPAARGVWMDMLCVMADGEPHGHLLVNKRPPTDRQLASVFGCSEKDAKSFIKELEDAGVFSRNDDGVIFSRRMVRDKQASKQAAATGAEGGNPNLRRGVVAKEDRVRPYRRADSPAKTQRIFEKRGGRCWWCDCVLQREKAGADFFHVDHLIPVCDGGTNDETNLVPACAKCNHDRAMVSPTRTSGGSDSNGGGYCRNDTDTKHQEAEAESESEKKEPPSLRSGPPQRGSTGTRLPEDWQPDPACIAFADSLSLNATLLAQQFRDYWHALPGSKARKLDWPATWRTWCRREAERPKPRASPAPSESRHDASVRQMMRMLDLNEPDPQPGFLLQ